MSWRKRNRDLNRNLIQRFVIVCSVSVEKPKLMPDNGQHSEQIASLSPSSVVSDGVPSRRKKCGFPICMPDGFYPGNGLVIDPVNEEYVLV